MGIRYFILRLHFSSLKVTFFSRFLDFFGDFQTFPEISSFLHFALAFTNAIANSTRDAHPLTDDSTAAGAVNVSSRIKDLFVNYTALTGEQVFLLDAEDVFNNAYGYCSESNGTFNFSQYKYAQRWWLRSASFEDDNSVGFVYEHGGNVYTYTTNGGGGAGISPAFNVNLDSILFSSNCWNNAYYLQGEQDYDNYYKLTLLDENMKIEFQKDNTVEYTGNTISVPAYTVTNDDANHIQATQVSVLITDKAYTESDASIKYYDVLSDEGNLSGTGTFTLPDELSLEGWGTDYHVYLIAENVNVDNADTEEIDEAQLTDYASKPVELHMHDFTYSASGAVVTASCSNHDNSCLLPEQKVKLTITAPALKTYGGKGSEKATLAGAEEFNSATGKEVSADNIVYYSGSKKLSATPKNAGTYKAQITVEGKTAKVSYTISPKNLSADNVTVVLTGETEPKITVKDGKTVLTENKDYEITESNGIFTVEGKGNYTGTINTYSYTSEKTPSCTEDGNIEYWTYDGVNYIKDNSGKFAVYADSVTCSAYGHSAAECTESGKEPTYDEEGYCYHVTYCTRCEEILSREEVTIPKLKRTNISSAKIQMKQTEFDYTGKKITPTFTVTLNGKTLVSGTDYTVSGNSATKSGT